MSKWISAFIHTPAADSVSPSWNPTKAQSETVYQRLSVLVSVRKRANSDLLNPHYVIKNILKIKT